MPMPWQLAKAFKPRKSTRPIAEQLPHINVNDLQVPRDYKTYISNVSLRYPQLTGVRIAWNMVEFTHKSLHRGSEGHTQTFGLKQIRTGLGGYFRHAFICSCGRPVIKLYIYHRNIACKRCCNARLASQTLGSKTRPVLQASRIQSFLEKIGLRQRTREALTKKLTEKVLMAQGRMGTKASGLWE
jgi:hypothetical protein